jgi:hypothetical protein
MIDFDERYDRLDMYIAEDRLIRGAWMGAANGRETACLLTALSPEVGERLTASACPSELMPAWMAYVTVWLNDSGSHEAWPGMVRRYATLARRWHVLTPEAWQRLDYAVRGLCVREAIRHTTDTVELAVCSSVVSLCDRAAAAAAAGAAVWATEEAAVWAAKVAAAARAAAGAAGRAAAVDRLVGQILDALEAAIKSATTTRADDGSP